MDRGLGCRYVGWLVGWCFGIRGTGYGGPSGDLGGGFGVFLTRVIVIGITYGVTYSVGWG